MGAMLASSGSASGKMSRSVSRVVIGSSIDDNLSGMGVWPQSPIGTNLTSIGGLQVVVEGLDGTRYGRGTPVPTLVAAACRRRRVFNVSKKRFL